jgi:hypothetical protein
MKTYGGVDVETHVLLTSALAGAEQPAASPGRFILIGWEAGWTPESVWMTWRSENS